MNKDREENGQVKQNLTNQILRDQLPDCNTQSLILWVVPFTHEGLGHTRLINGAGSSMKTSEAP